MKKSYIGLLLGTILCTGCTEKEEEFKYMNCQRLSTFNVFDIATSTKLIYQGEEVIHSETIEEISFYQNESVSEVEMQKVVEEMIKEFETQKRKMERNEAITFEYVVGDTYINTHGAIDYAKIDIEKMLKDDPNMKSFLDDGEFNIKKMKKNYESLGSVCTDLVS